MNLFCQIERWKPQHPESLAYVSKGPQRGLEMLWQVHALVQDADDQNVILCGLKEDDVTIDRGAEQ